MAAESPLHRWNPTGEWRENPDVPMPQAEAGYQRPEDTESLATGTPPWQVRVELGSHRQAAALARKLEDQSRRSCGTGSS